MSFGSNVSLPPFGEVGPVLAGPARKPVVRGQVIVSDPSVQHRPNDPTHLVFGAKIADVPPPREGFHVTAQVLRTHFVIDAHEGPLEHGPCRLGVVRRGLALQPVRKVHNPRVFACFVVDGVTLPFNAFIVTGFIRVDHGPVIRNDPVNYVLDCLGIGYDIGPYFSGVDMRDADYDHLGRSALAAGNLVQRMLVLFQSAHELWKSLQG